MRVPKADRWLLLAIVVLTVGGTLLLRQAPCRAVSERDEAYFGTYVTWQAAFDALSATCGVGLLTSDWNGDYTDAGRWTLTGLGTLGAVIYLVLALRVLRAMGASLTIWATPPAGVVLGLLGALVVVAGLLCGALAATGGADDGGGGPLAAVRLGLVAVLSLGLATPEEVAGRAGVLAGLAWLAALGWPMWLFLIPALTHRYVQARQALLVAATYTVLLALFAGGLMVFELPRGGAALRPGPDAEVAEAVGYGARFSQVTLASGAGLRAGGTPEAELRDGSKVLLSLALLLGPASYGVAGGLTWILLVWAVTGALFGLRQRGDAGPHLSLWCSSALAACFLLGAAAVVGALGLILIEGLSGSRFAHPPGFADALLDASAVIGGGNLTTGVVASVTSENLISGKGLPANAYALGMGWVMLLMVIGRVVPLLVLRRLAERVSPDWKHQGTKVSK